MTWKYGGVLVLIDCGTVSSPTSFPLLFFLTSLHVLFMMWMGTALTSTPSLSPILDPSETYHTQEETHFVCTHMH